MSLPVPVFLARIWNQEIQEVVAALAGRLEHPPAH
jgi:hypothetical protein